MNDIISEELLSDVLGKKVIIRGFVNKYIPENFEYIEDSIILKTISIYELAHKSCKQWAKDNGYIITSNILGSVTISKLESPLSIIAWVDNTLELSKLNEEFSVIKACQWVYDNKARNE